MTQTGHRYLERRRPVGLRDILVPGPQPQRGQSAAVLGPPDRRTSASVPARRITVPSGGVAVVGSGDAVIASRGAVIASGAKPRLIVTPTNAVQTTRQLRRGRSLTDRLLPICRSDFCYLWSGHVRRGDRLTLDARL